MTAHELSADLKNTAREKLAGYEVASVITYEGKQQQTRQKGEDT